MDFTMTRAVIFMEPVHVLWESQNGSSFGVFFFLESKMFFCIKENVTFRNCSKILWRAQNGSSMESLQKSPFMQTFVLRVLFSTVFHF